MSSDENATAQSSLIFLDECTFENRDKPKKNENVCQKKAKSEMTNETKVKNKSQWRDHEMQ